jgi:hypothetical protein
MIRKEEIKSEEEAWKVDVQKLDIIDILNLSKQKRVTTIVTVSNKKEQKEDVEKSLVLAQQIKSCFNKI